EFVEGVAGWVPGLAALKSGAGSLLVETGLRLTINRRAELALDSIWNQRSKLAGDARDSEYGDADQRGGGGNGPKNDFAAQPAFDTPAAVDWLGQLINFPRQFPNADFQAGADPLSRLSP